MTALGPTPKKANKTEEQIDAFRRDLAEVYAKHGMCIDACGCCGSPWISVVDEKTAREMAEGMA